MNAVNPPPAPLARPKLARWLWERDLTLREAAPRIGRSRQWLQLICLPFNDPRRRIPDEDDIRRIVEWTGGEVTAADFYPPDLLPAAPGAVAASPEAEP